MRINQLPEESEFTYRLAPYNPKPLSDPDGGTQDCKEDSQHVGCWLAGRCARDAALQSSSSHILHRPPRRT